MYTLCGKGAIVLQKHKWLYYLLSYTWGFIMTFIGLVISLVLLVFKKKPQKYHRIYYFEVGEAWGGLEMGQMFLTDNSPSETLKYHEYGHTFQNAILGPLFPLLVGIPSALRYWYRELFNITYPRYDAIWFEGSATDIGEIVTNL